MRPLVAGGLLLAGALTGVASLAVHTRGWGLPLAAAASLATLVSLPPGWWSRLAFVVGWLVPVGVVFVGRPEGDFVLGQTPSGYAVLLLAVVLTAVALGSLPPPRRRG